MLQLERFRFSEDRDNGCFTYRMVGWVEQAGQSRDVCQYGSLKETVGAFMRMLYTQKLTRADRPGS